MPASSFDSHMWAWGNTVLPFQRLLTATILAPSPWSGPDHQGSILLLVLLDVRDWNSRLIDLLDGQNDVPGTNDVSICVLSCVCLLRRTRDAPGAFLSWLNWIIRLQKHLWENNSSLLLHCRDFLLELRTFLHLHRGRGTAGIIIGDPKRSSLAKTSEVAKHTIIQVQVKIKKLKQDYNNVQSWIFLQAPRTLGSQNFLVEKCLLSISRWQIRQTCA